MKKTFFILIFLGLFSCGVKTAPTPIYPGFPSRTQSESERRGELERSKEIKKEESSTDEEFLEEYYGKKPIESKSKEKSKKVKGK